MWDLTQLGSVPSAAATAFGAWVALRISSTWRQQLVAKRRQEVAEQALLAAYNARPALRTVRSPWIGPKEQQDETGAPGGAYYAIRDRLDKSRAEQDALTKVAFLVDVHFGEAASDPIRGIYSLFNHVSAANFALGMSKNVTLDPERLISLSAKRMAPEDESPDPVAKEMDRLVSELERILKPYLRLPDELDPTALDGPWYRRRP